MKPMRKAGGGGERNRMRRGSSRSSKDDETHLEASAELKKGPWTAEEDELLSRYIEKQGEGGWRTLPKRAGLLRCGKSCRLRWMNYLRPNVKRGHISPDEEDLILRLHRLLGNRWSLIAGRIPGRTDNEIKNYWNTHLSKKLIRQGIDPRTHKPFSVSHYLIPSNPIKPDHGNNTNHNNGASPKSNYNANPNSTATVSESSSSSKAHPCHPPLSHQTRVSSPVEEDNNNNDNMKDLIRDDQLKVGTTNSIIRNITVAADTTTSYRVATTETTAVSIPKPMQLDCSSTMINQEQKLHHHYYNDDLDNDIILHDHINGDADDDIFSSFLSSLINDEDFIFSCNTIDDAVNPQQNGHQPSQQLGVIPAAPPAQRGEDSREVIMNITETSPSLFRVSDNIGGQWDDPFQS